MKLYRAFERLPCRDDVSAALDYDPLTGLFKWKVRRSWRVLAGDEAGNVCPRGYRRIAFNRVQIGAHRLAWLLVHRAWPEFDIDHIDGNRANNAISNLRDVPNVVNAQNQRRPRKAKQDPLPLGVCVIGARKNKRFKAQIVAFGVKHHLGMFYTAEEAHAAYVQAKRRLHAGCTI